MLINYGCESKSKKLNKEKSSTSQKNNANLQTTLPNQDGKLMANIYLENSGSMFGYISGGSNFIKVVSTIAGDCDLECSQVNYNLINATTTPLGQNLSSFTNSLSLSGMNKGNTATSDLNNIFEKVLSKAGEGSISCLISDGIYSVKADNIITRLQTESMETRNAFVHRLKAENLTTYLIKYSSNFNGKYYPAKGGAVSINQDRPFFLWIIGNDQDIQKVFSEDYFSKLPGFQEIAIFVQLNNNPVPSQLCIHNQLGKYRFRNPKVLQLTDVEPNRNRETSFSMAFDFSGIPVASDYFFNKDVYENDLKFEVTNITTPDNIAPTAKAGLQGTYTHVVTLKKTGYPCGKMNLSVMNNVPSWIEKTNIDNDDDIQNNTSQTLGFKYLIEGIANAYKKVNNRENITQFEINIRQD
jgi:hypothetical protein